MSDYLPVEVILEILNRLPVKSVVKCRKNGKCDYFLHYDIDGFEEFKQLQFPPFGYAADSLVVGSCNGLICLQLYPYNPYKDVKFLLWNPSIQKYISLPEPSFTVVSSYKFGFGFGFDSRTNDYKLLIVGVYKDGSVIQPYLFSLNGNCWRKVTAAYLKYAFGPYRSLPFVNGALHWLGYQRRNNDEYSHAILGFDLSSEDFFEINLPESLIGLCPMDLLIMNYGESSIAVYTHPMNGEFFELWVMKEYGVVESWTKVLTLQPVGHYPKFPRVLGFRKNGEVLLQVDDGEMASLDLNSQQMEPQGVLIGEGLTAFDFSYVESLVLHDKGNPKEPCRTLLPLKHVSAFSSRSRAFIAEI